MALLIAIAGIVVLGACGAVATGTYVSNTPTTSPARTESPSTSPARSRSPLPVPDANILSASNCNAAAAAAPIRPLGSDFTIRPAANWTDTGDYQNSETRFLLLKAPDAYGFAPTTLEFAGGAVGFVHTIFGPGATAHSVAQQHVDSIAQEMLPGAAAGRVRDCTVGGDAAAAYGFSDGPVAGFFIYFIHNDGLMKIVLVGSGGLSSQAIQDALGMIGSFTWLVPDALQLTDTNCSGIAAATAPRLLGRPYFTIRPAPNWTDTTGNDQHNETLVLELTAPPAYGSPPIKIGFLSDLGAVSTGATARSIAQKHADAILNEVSTQAVAGTVRDCTVGGEPAAGFGFFDGTSPGYRLFVVHGDLLFEVVLYGVGDQAIQDSLGMIGSLTWAF
jgi:hypothetical protein